MRILLSSPTFFPAIGGIPVATLLFANEMIKRGYDLTLVTGTPGDNLGYDFKLRRLPTNRELFKLIEEADLVWHNNLSLRAYWPLIALPRPLIITHQTWLAPDIGPGRRLGGLKRLACMRGRNVFISRALADGVGLPGAIIPNAYDAETFRLLPAIPRDRDIVYVGRLVSDKGVDVLLDALAQLAARQIFVRATVIGDGPEADTLKQQAISAGLGDNIVFLGTMTGAPLAEELNRHSIMVVPSRWKEPFGIVALEGAACGCVVVGTTEGGLPDAIGPCGPVVANGDAAGLADSLNSLICDATQIPRYREKAQAHLEKFTPAAVIDSYEKIISQMVTRKAD